MTQSLKNHVPDLSALLQNQTSLESIAVEITRDYQTAMSGMRSYVLMGLRLHLVKNNLPHGAFLNWCDSCLDIKKVHIANAMRTAKDLCDVTGIEMSNALDICENSPSNPIFELIEGKTHRQLHTDLHRYRNDPSEVEAQKWCEDRWSKNPIDRDDWAPRVLSGEITYIHAKIGMLGIEATKGQTRPAINHLGLLDRNAGSYLQLWKQWDALPESTRHSGIEKLQDAITAAPAEVRHALLKSLQHS